VQFTQTRHVGAVQRGRVGIVTALECRGFVPEVPLYQLDLIAGRRVLDDDAQHAARLGHAENMRAARQIEWHDLRAHVVDVFLPALPKRRRTADGKQDGEDAAQVAHRKPRKTHRPPHSSVGARKRLSPVCSALRARSRARGRSAVTRTTPSVRT